MLITLINCTYVRKSPSAYSIGPRSIETKKEIDRGSRKFTYPESGKPIYAGGCFGYHSSSS